MKIKSVVLAMCLALLVCVYPVAAGAEGESYDLVTRVSQLSSGDEVILLSDDGSGFFTMGRFGGVAVNVTDFSAVTAPAGTLVLTLEQGEGGWLLTSGDQYLSAQDGALCLGDGATPWSISISGEEATLSCDAGAISFDGETFTCGADGTPVSLYARATGHTYTVTWLNYDGTVLAATPMKYGSMPAYPGETPAKPHDSDYSYQFTGWSPAPAAVTGDISYTAQYQANKKCGQSAYWTFDADSGTLTISGTGALYGYLTVDNQPWASFRTEITSVLIPEGITEINMRAFNGCTGLAAVSIPNSVVKVGQSAFEETAFWNAQSDGLVYLDHVLLGVKGTMTQQIVRITSGTRLIADYALQNCTSVVKCTIPDSVVSIGSYAFSGCTGLTSVSIPGNISLIPSYAFLGCTGLTSFTVPGTVSEISTGAFKECKGLVSVTLENGVRAIADGAFRGCWKLESITIPDSVTTIGSYAFYGCSKLGSVTIPGSVRTIYSYAFSMCSGLTSVSIQNGTAVIEANAFSGCTQLARVDLPASVTSMGKNAFANCSRLTDVYYDGREADKAQTTIGSGNTYLTNAAWHYLRCGEDLTWVFDSDTGTLSITGSGALDDFASAASQPWASVATKIKTVSLPEGLTAIGSYAFYGCTNLTTIDIPEGVIAIGSYAFYSCGKLASIDLPDALGRINDYTFAKCTALTSMEVPDSVAFIGPGAFSGCSALQSVNVPSGITTIYDHTFANCSSLSFIYIPLSLTEVYSKSFTNTPNYQHVLNIHYEGTKAQSLKITGYLL